MKTGNWNGTVQSFFTYWEGPNWSDGQWNEIDVEIVPSEQLRGVSPFSSNFITGDGGSHHNNHQESLPMPSNWDEFHTYQIQWTPDSIQWQVDGRWVREVKGGDAVDFMNKYQHVFMSVWNPTYTTGWGAGFDESILPIETLYDWVEIYSYDIQTKSFHWEWREDFNDDTLDTTRWNAGEGWGYGDSTCMFKRSQVYQSGGSLHIKMDHWGNNEEEVNEEQFLQ